MYAVVCGHAFVVWSLYTAMYSAILTFIMVQM